MAHFFVWKRFEGISSLTDNIIPPPFISQSDQNGALNSSIKKFPMGKLYLIWFLRSLKYHKF